MSWFKYLKDRIQGKAEKGQRRSSEWRTVREEHLKKNPKCAVCESSKKLEVHHIIPFHIAPDLELDPDNLLTLCEHGRLKSINCHLLIGHLGDYKRVNPSVELDAMTWHHKLKND